MVSGEGVVIFAAGVAGADVHGDVIEFGDVVKQAMVGLVGDVVGRDDAESAVDEDADLGADAVPDPAQPQVFDVLDAGHRAEAGLGGVDELRFDGVHESPVSRWVPSVWGGAVGQGRVEPRAGPETAEAIPPAQAKQGGRDADALALYETAERLHTTAGRHRDAATLAARIGSCLGSIGNTEEAISGMRAALPTRVQSATTYASPNCNRQCWGHLPASPPLERPIIYRACRSSSWLGSMNT